MNFIWEDLEPTTKKLKVEVPAETVTDRIQKALAQVRRNAKFKGFRPGKAPLAMIKRMYGAQIEQEVTQELINESVPKALEEVEYELAAAPNLEESDYKMENLIGSPFLSRSSPSSTFPDTTASSCHGTPLM